MILSTNNKQSTGKIHVNTKNNLSKLNNIYINSAYALGIDEIDLETSSTKSIDLSQNIGFTIMNQKNNILKIKDISGLGQENAEEIFKRVFQLIISFYESAIDNIINNQNADENTINNIDSEINKFVLFLQRSIMKQNNIDETSGKILFAYSFGLEHIGDEISRM